MGSIVESRTLLAADQSLSEETKRLRDAEQERLTNAAFEEAMRLLSLHREALDRLAEGLLEHEALDRTQLAALLADIKPERVHSDEVGRVIGVAAARDARREPPHERARVSRCSRMPTRAGGSRRALRLCRSCGACTAVCAGGARRGVAAASRKSPLTVAGAVIAHDPLDLDAALGKRLVCVLEERDRSLRSSVSGAPARRRSASGRRSPGAGIANQLDSCACAPSLSARLPTCQKRPSCLLSKCTSPPGAAYS